MIDRDKRLESKLLGEQQLNMRSFEKNFTLAI